MAGMIESTTIPLSTGSILEQSLTLIIAVRTELILFCLALLLHQLIFGSMFRRACRSVKKVDFDATTSVRKVQRRGVNTPPGLSAPPGLDEPIEHQGDADQALRCSEQAFERGDHRAVLRLWNDLRCNGDVPAAHLAQVVETMQRTQKDSASILAEVQGYFHRNSGACHISYVNKVLETATKSLDIDIVNGLLELLTSLDIKANKDTYQMLIQMHFTTRNFQEVSKLSDEMQAKKLMPTSHTSLILLKAAIQAGNLDESMRWFKEMSLDTTVPTASQAPKHIMTQLVELACRERRVDVVLADLGTGRIPLSAENMNSMLAESVRMKDNSIAEQVKQLVAAQRVELNSRSYQYLILGAGNDCQYISKLLTEMLDNRVECLHEVVTSVLSVCAASSSVTLANQLYKLVNMQQASSIPALLLFVRFYAEAGEPESACTVYDEHLKGQNVDCNWRRGSGLDSKTEKCLITAALQCGRKDIAADLVVSSPTDTAKHISMIRKSASKGDLLEALSIFDSLEVSGADLTNSLFNSLLDACVECSDMKQAEVLMTRMVAAGKADAISYNTLIKAHLRQENYQGAQSVMETMRKVGCLPNVVTYNELINALVRSDKDIHRAKVWDVVEEMKEQGVCPNKITLSILFRSLKARSSQADVVRAMDLTERMQEPMDEVLMSSIIEACVRIGKPGLLTQKLDQLHGNGVKVTGAHTFGSLIKAYGTAHDMDGAWRCWKAMRSQHVKPTSITIGCMVEAVVSNGDADGGYELISQLLEDDKCKNQVNAIIFGSVIKGFARTKRMDRVWVVFKEMLSRSIEPSVATFNTVIDACTRNNQVDAIEGLLEDMKSRRIEPNLITYSTVIKGVCQKGNMSGAFKVFKDLKRAPKVKPDEIVYNTMLDGCATAGLVTEGEEIFQEMQKDGLTPTNYTLTVLVRLMGQGHRLQRAFEIIETFAQKFRVRANSHVYTALIQACLTCHDLSRAAEAFEKALHSRAQPDQRVCQSLIRAFTSAGKAEYAVGLLRALLGLPTSCLPSFSKSNQSGTQIDDSFINDIVSCLLEGGADARSLAPPLVADILAVRPKLRMDPSTDRNLALTVARNHGNPVDTSPKKTPPWRR